MSQPITILFYPEMPEPESTAYQLCTYLGYRLTNNPTQAFDVAFKYFDATFFSADLLDVFDDIHDDVINGHSLDISKNRVGEVFQSVFGYDININPVSDRGLGFQKSDINRWRDGEMVQLPLAADVVDQDVVYQKFVDTETDGEYVDISVPIYDGVIPCVVLQARSHVKLTDAAKTVLTVKETVSIFSEAEIQQLTRCAQGLRLDYGEFDVLRDRHDGKIYIVDVNNTPCEFPQGLTAMERELLLEKLSNAFVPLIAKRL
ncbi:hypothetical protein [[Limnothrix rosea] IAM M-220]|uniref:hypothetical protein n=1 Tax=[Limnothrix rosea] IAM M-220 TaxID=454133 RepID=UPI000965E33B|nr:hypothetical protein [[Limnothrix rosea] IAM M-220]OKH19221.1 hypothetical protein NIES208_02930 [[Limnothrix rosea] IAM M-220]